MDTMELVEPMSIIYCLNGSMMTALPYDSNNSKYIIDQKCKERISLSKGKQTLLYINWLINPKCNFDCKYCYAKDVMQCNQEPQIDTLINTAQSILRLDPVVVTLSGGEPFLSPYLEKIILYLEGKTHLIIDTNGSINNHLLLQTIKKKDVLLRVSLDDINTRRNSKTRGHFFSGAHQTMNCIKKCIQIGIDVVVQTVVTTINYNYLQKTKKYLQKNGVKHWRLLPVSISNPEMDFLKCSPQEIYRLRKLFCQCTDMDIAIQEEYEKEMAGIVLVSPDGTFLTVNNQGKKVCIDPHNPSNPSIEVFNKVIDWDAHSLRYIIDRK